jgi:hypothetical protein
MRESARRAAFSALRLPFWLHRKIQGAPFSRRTPIEYMVAHGMEGMAHVLQYLNRAAMRAALTKQARH